MNIVDELISLRKTHGLTQAALASRAGLARITINKIENGVVDPQLSTLEEYGRVLDVEFMAVPRHLKAELESFLKSGGRFLAQPTGASAPKSVVDEVLGRS
jgi:DNA-binding XRE family transcriptional regulator